jgi:SAM-dependent methyltransferase
MHTRNPVERRYAEFYQLYTRDFRKDIPIYLEFAAKVGGPVLEIGCRTGRVACQLAGAGHDVLAIDTERPMLEVGVEQVRPFSERVRMADHDVRQQPTAERFPVVLVTLFSFNDLIDVEEQRLFLRHVKASMRSPGIVALDLFCPLFLARPDDSGEWREIERTAGDVHLKVRDRREMLTPLLERRTQVFEVAGGPSGEYTSHRRYITPQQAQGLMAEAGFENVRWVRDYDLGTAEPIAPESRPAGPFLVIGEL